MARIRNTRGHQTCRSNGPLSYNFPEWKDWIETTPGRRLKIFAENLLQNYLNYFP